MGDREMSLYYACHVAFQKFVKCKDPGSFLHQNEFIDELIDYIMQGIAKRDPLFREIFRDVTFTGSSYEGLKIGLPDEYDVNINLYLPMMASLKVYADPRPQFAGFVTIGNFSTALESVIYKNHDVYQKMVSWRDAEGNLIPDRVRNWFQGLVHSFVNDEWVSEILHCHPDFNLEFVHLKRSGPATTLQIRMENGFDIDIDLVPALVFNNIDPPYPLRPLPENYIMPWSVVPKTKPRPRRKVKKWNRDYAVGPPKFRQGNKFRKQNTEGIHWRLSFWRVEKEMMKNRQRMKPAIKMIKRLRDVRKWNSLSSYFIKTVALYELNNHDWNRLRLDHAFIELLKRLQHRMEQNCLRFYWDHRCNLLQGRMKDIERKEIAKRLSRDINRFQDYPVDVINVLRGDD